MSNKNRRTKSSSTLMDVNIVTSIKTDKKTFKNGEEILKLCKDRIISSKINQVFEPKTLDEIAKYKSQIDVFVFEYHKEPLTDNIKEVYGIFHDMNSNLEETCYWVAPSYIHENNTITYICLFGNK